MDPITPFQRPLSEEAWRQALATGHGRALLDARAFGFRPEIKDQNLDAVLYCKNFDPQCESDRKPLVLETAKDEPRQSHFFG